MKVLVTGANGQLAQCLRKRAGLGSNGTEFIFLDKTQLNITDKKLVIDFFKANYPDIVVNCAAYTNVDKAEDDIELSYQINCKGAENLAEACKETNSLLLHISTDYIFDGKQNTPYKEDDKENPIGIYGKTKAQGEKAIIDSSCNYMIIRTSWLYSCYGSNFLKTMLRLMKERESLNVVFDQVGTPTYAQDLADALFAIIQEGKLAALADKEGKIHDIFHYSNLGVCSWFDFSTEIQKASGIKCKVNPCHSSEFPSKVTRPSYSVLDKTKFCNTFKIQIPYWRDSMQKAICEIKNLG